MEALLAAGAWSPVTSPNAETFGLLRKQKALYAQIENSEAWKDFMARLTQMREGTRLALERGVVDSHGQTHEPEQRAVMYVLEQLMGYVPGINRDYEQMLTALKTDESIANAPVYGDDMMMDLTSDI